MKHIARYRSPTCPSVVAREDPAIGVHCRRPELQGGGLFRSAGGNNAGCLGRKKEEREKGDQRILGSGDFVNEALMKAGEEWESQKGLRPSLEALINTVSEAM